jgi:hypothetical protein
MRRILLSMTISALIWGTAGTAFAETVIHQRKQNQQKRIANGVNKGSLTARETARLEHQEAKLNREIRSDRKANGGNLTNKEKVQIQHQQNQLSRRIYRQKHDGQSQ